MPFIVKTRSGLMAEQINQGLQQGLLAYMQGAKLGMEHQKIVQAGEAAEATATFRTDTLAQGDRRIAAQKEIAGEQISVARDRLRQDRGIAIADRFLNFVKIAQGGKELRIRDRMAEIAAGADVIAQAEFERENGMTAAEVMAKPPLQEPPPGGKPDPDKDFIWGPPSGLGAQDPMPFPTGGKAGDANNALNLETSSAVNNYDRILQDAGLPKIPEEVLKALATVGVRSSDEAAYTRALATRMGLLIDHMRGAGFALEQKASDEATAFLSRPLSGTYKGIDGNDVSWSLTPEELEAEYGTMYRSMLEGMDFMNPMHWEHLKTNQQKFQRYVRDHRAVVTLINSEEYHDQVDARAGDFFVATEYAQTTTQAGATGVGAAEYGGISFGGGSDRVSSAKTHGMHPAQSAFNAWDAARSKLEQTVNVAPSFMGEKGRPHMGQLGNLSTMGSIPNLLRLHMSVTPQEYKLYKSAGSTGGAGGPGGQQVAAVGTYTSPSAPAGQPPVQLDHLATMPPAQQDEYLKTTGGIADPAEREALRFANVSGVGMAGVPVIQEQAQQRLKAFRATPGGLRKGDGTIDVGARAGDSRFAAWLKSEIASPRSSSTTRKGAPGRSARYPFQTEHGSGNALKLSFDEGVAALLHTGTGDQERKLSKMDLGHLITLDGSNDLGDRKLVNGVKQYQNVDQAKFQYLIQWADHLYSPWGRQRASSGGGR